MTPDVWFARFLIASNWLFLVYLTIVNGFQGVQFLASAYELIRRRRAARLEIQGRVLSSKVAPRVSILVPAYNEGATIEQSLRALVTLAYPNLEIVVVDDGSTDDTLEVMRRSLGLQPSAVLYEPRLEMKEILAVYRARTFPGLVVATKVNGGKADALNAAMSLATGDLVCAVDADTLIEVDALEKLIRPFLASESLAAAGATIRVANGSMIDRGRVVRRGAPRSWLPGTQAVEYLRGFLFGRIGWNRLGGNLVISGAFGLFRRETLMQIGGYAAGVGEDMELVTRLRRSGYERGHVHGIEFVPDPVAWTEVPQSARVLGRQRDRWHRGLSEVLWRHRRLMFNPRYGVLGLFVFPVFVIVEWLAPVIEGAGLVLLVVSLALGAVDTEFAILFFLFAFLLGLLLSVSALALEEFAFRAYGGARDRAFLLLWAFLESLGYRQLTVWWRLKGIWKFLRGRNDWGVMERTGFAAASAPAPDGAPAP